MSLYEGPTNFLSTAWQAMQLLALAKASLAMAGADKAAKAVNTNAKRFMCVL
jgi:hypothetical protein